jgi:aminopeptidase N
VLERLLQALAEGGSPRLDDALAEALRAVLRHPTLDPAFKALALVAPDETYVAEQLAQSDPQRVHEVRESWRDQLAARLHDDWVWAWEQHQVREGYAATPAQGGRRALANLALAKLCRLAVRSGDAVWQGKAYQRFKDATNLTDRLGAATALLDAHSSLGEQVIDRLQQMAQGDALVLDKWFALQAGAAEAVGEGAGRVFTRARALLQHPAFSLRNPNRVRSLLFVLCSNPAAFHRADASGYVLWSEKLLELDALNPQLAGRLARLMDRWSALAEPYRSAAREAIARVAARSDLSDDVREVVGRALEPNP